MFQESEKATSEEFLDNNGNFSASKMIYYIRDVGSKVIFNKDTPESGQLPSYFDERKFRRAQKVFKKYKTNLLLSQFTGLLILLIHPEAIQIIMMTERSSEPSTARARYKKTLKHVLMWYTKDFCEDSELWKSVYRVRQMHHAANLQAKKHPGVQQITQFELALTIFGFIGFAVVRPNHFGLDDINEKELEALVHFWRIIGYLMGVEDRFNICRESLEESKEIFERFTEIFCKHYVKLRNPDSLQNAIRGNSGNKRIYVSIRSKEHPQFHIRIDFSGS